MFLIAISTVFLLAAALVQVGWGGRGFGRIPAFLLALLTLFLLLFWYVANRFTSVGINDAVIYTLRYGLAEAGYDEYTGLMSIIAVALFVGAGILGYIFLRKHNPHSFNLLPFVLLTASLGFNPGLHDLIRLRTATTAGNEQSEPFEAYYRTPAIHSTPDAPKNILFIYGESLERTYFDETVFPNLVTELRKYESVAVDFTNVQQLPGTSWTVAGMTASQLGIPLVTTSGHNSMAGMDQFLPNAIGLGDLLSEQGYHMAYMGGASVQFGGKGKLLASHGFNDIQGREDLEWDLPDHDYQSGWGLFDDSLFEVGWDKFVALSEAEQPFGLFMLTLDTHGSGYASASCDDLRYEDGGERLLNAVACSDRLITQFVDQVMASPYAEDTVIVIASDHFSGTSLNWRLDQVEPRSNLFLVIEPGQEQQAAQIDTLGSTLDIGPTLLSFLGFEADLGLGRNLLDQSTAAEREIIHSSLSGWAEDVQQFWEFPRIKDELSIDVWADTMQINGRSFRIPSLISLDESLNTSLAFDLYEGERVLNELLPELDVDQRFVLIDRCSNIEQVNLAVSRTFCLLAGVGQTETFYARIDHSVTLTADYLQALLQSDARQIAPAIEGITPDPFELEHVTGVQFGGELSLEGYAFSLWSNKEGESAETPPHNAVTITLQWQVNQTPTADHTLFLHVVNAGGERFGQLDQVMGGHTPTSTWLQGQTWYESYTVDLPPDLPANSYSFNLGIYDWPSFDHLLLNESDQFWNFGELIVPENISIDE